MMSHTRMMGELAICCSIFCCCHMYGLVRALLCTQAAGVAHDDSHCCRQSLLNEGCWLLCWGCSGHAHMDSSCAEEAVLLPPIQLNCMMLQGGEARRTWQRQEATPQLGRRGLWWRGRGPWAWQVHCTGLPLHFAHSAPHAVGWDHWERCTPCTCMSACDRSMQCRSS